MSFATKAGIVLGAAAFSGMAVANTGNTSNDLQSRLEAAEAKIAEMSAQQNGDWLTEQRSEQISGIVQDVLADADTRASLQGTGATSGYNNGFFVQSADGKWSMKINGLFQERFNIGHQPGDWQSGTVGGANDKNTSFGFETTRAALNFSGELAGVAYYNARLDWSPYNGNNGLSTTPLQWAYGGWHVNDNWSVQLGRQKMMVTRGFMVNAEDQQAIERSSYDYAWASSQITNGVMLKGNWDQFRMNAMFSNGSDVNAGNGAAQNSWQNNVNGWGITGRGEWLLQGDWSQFNHIGSSKGETNGMLLGVGGGYIKQNQKAFGAAAAANVPSAWLVSSDLSYEADGWNAYASGSYQRTNDGGTNSEDINSVGFEVGAGMYMDDDNELYGRWQWINPGFGSGVPSSTLNMATIGWNHYLAGPNTKLSVDWSWNFSDPSAVNNSGAGGWGYTGWWNNANANGTNSTTGSQWLLRTQLQVSF